MTLTLRRGSLAAAFAFLFLAAGCDSSSAFDGADATAGGNDTVTNTTPDDCDGTLGSIRVENVIVPAGASCTLAGTFVQGNVIVNAGAYLRAAGARVGGNIQAEDADLVEVVRGTTVGGNIQVKQGGGAEIVTAIVDGDVQIEQNYGPVVAEDNRVRGNLQVNQNTGGVTLIGNRVAENMQCQANQPPPRGAGNVAGDKEDQCAHL